MVDRLHLRAVNADTEIVTRDQLDDELNRLSIKIDKANTRTGIAVWCAVYRALRWARDPKGHAPPSEE